MKFIILMITAFVVAGCGNAPENTQNKISAKDQPTNQINLRSQESNTDLMGWWSGELDLKPGDLDYPFKKYSRELVNVSNENVDRYRVIGNDSRPNGSQLKYKVLDEKTIEFSNPVSTFRGEYKLSADRTKLEICFQSGTCKNLDRIADPKLKTGKHEVPRLYAHVALICLDSKCSDNSKVGIVGHLEPLRLDDFFSKNYRMGVTALFGGDPNTLYLRAMHISHLIGNDILNPESYGFLLQFEVVDHSQNPPKEVVINPSEQMQFYQLKKPYHWEFNYEGKKITYDLELTDDPNG